MVGSWSPQSLSSMLMVSSMSSGLAAAQVVMYRYRDFFRMTSWESDAAHVMTCACGGSGGRLRSLCAQSSCIVGSCRRQKRCRAGISPAQAKCCRSGGVLCWGRGPEEMTGISSSGQPRRHLHEEAGHVLPDRPAHDNLPEQLSLLVDALWAAPPSAEGHELRSQLPQLPSALPIPLSCSAAAHRKALLLFCSCHANSHVLQQGTLKT